MSLQTLWCQECHSDFYV